MRSRQKEKNDKLGTVYDKAQNDREKERWALRDGQLSSILFPSSFFDITKKLWSILIVRILFWSLTLS